MKSTNSQEKRSEIKEALCNTAGGFVIVLTDGQKNAREVETTRGLVIIFVLNCLQSTAISTICNFWGEYISQDLLPGKGLKMNHRGIFQTGVCIVAVIIGLFSLQSEQVRIKINEL